MKDVSELVLTLCSSVEGGGALARGAGPSLGTYSLRMHDQSRASVWRRADPEPAERLDAIHSVYDRELRPTASRAVRQPYLPEGVACRLI